MREYKSFYRKAGGNEGSRCRYPVRLDTYGCGCAHDCGYCYARSLLAFRGLWHPMDPSVADIGKIRRKLDRVPAGTVLRLGGMCDGLLMTDRDIISCQTFPQDYDFAGQRIRYVCGMSVPPVMMARISEQVWLQWLRSLKDLNKEKQDPVDNDSWQKDVSTTE